jgi:uncharacterized protein (DUF736 family)
MAYEIRDNSGTLFANDRKETENHPDYTGQAMIDGTDYWLSAWKKKSQGGKTYLSFSFKPKDAAKPQMPAVGSYTADDDDPGDCPF